MDNDVYSQMVEKTQSTISYTNFLESVKNVDLQVAEAIKFAQDHAQSIDAEFVLRLAVDCLNIVHQIEQPTFYVIDQCFNLLNTKQQYVFFDNISAELIVLLSKKDNNDTSMYQFLLSKQQEKRVTASLHNQNALQHITSEFAVQFLTHPFIRANIYKQKFKEEQVFSFIEHNIISFEEGITCLFLNKHVLDNIPDVLLTSSERSSFVFEQFLQTNPSTDDLNKIDCFVQKNHIDVAYTLNNLNRNLLTYIEQNPNVLFLLNHYKKHFNIQEFCLQHNDIFLYNNIFQRAASIFNETDEFHPNTFIWNAFEYFYKNDILLPETNNKTSDMYEVFCQKRGLEIELEQITHNISNKSFKRKI